MLGVPEDPIVGVSVVAPGLGASVDGAKDEISTVTVGFALGRSDSSGDGAAVGMKVMLVVLFRSKILNETFLSNGGSAWPRSLIVF